MNETSSSSHLSKQIGFAAEAPRRLTIRRVDPNRGVALAMSLLRSLFKHLPFRFDVRIWTGPPFSVGSPAGPPEPRFTLHLRTPRVVTALLLGKNPLRLAESYFNSDLDIEGNFYAALQLKDHLDDLKLSFSEKLKMWVMAHQLRAADMRRLPRQGHGAVPRPATSGGRFARFTAQLRANKHTKDENLEAIRFHYDVSNDFYRIWLDRAMVYSCAYFEDSRCSLDTAQQAKLEHICRKLMLRPGERLLDIGCGWGALVIHAAQHYGVRAHGITLSERQLEVAQRRIAEAGLEQMVTVELRDYRDLEGNEVYDKVASVGMVEHVGIGNLPAYFDVVRRVLKPGGLFLNHGITHARSGWAKTVSTEFINRYVFPDGQLDRISNMQRFMEDAQFEIADVEALGTHYAKTLRTWVSRLERRRTQALQYVSEATYRIWRLYMAACALEFESGDINVYQVLAAKRGTLKAKLPMTRRHLYRRPASGTHAP